MKTFEDNAGQRDSDEELVQHAIDQLGEHFDTVQIFCTRHEAGEQQGTVVVQEGCGNWFARWGQVRDWVLREKFKIQIEEQVTYSDNSDE